MPVLAAIDLGSNAARMNIVEAPDRSGSTVLGQIRFPLRLGHDVFRTGEISEQNLRHALDAFTAFSELMAKYDVQACKAIATSAVRESENRDQFLERITSQTGIRVQIVSATEEARLLMQIIRERLNLGNERILHVEVGGGSIELSVFDGTSCHLSTSLKLGALRLHEMFLADRAGPENTRTEAEFIERMLSGAVEGIRALRPARMIATGGNPKSLARLAGDANSPGDRPEPRFVPAAQLDAMVRRLTSMSYEARLGIGLEPDRADVIVPAGHLLSRLLEMTGFDGFWSIDLDLRDGLIRELSAEFFSREQHEAEETDVVLNAAFRLGRRLCFDERHSAHVMKLATRLFAALQPGYDLGQRDLLLLRVAALLHDVGHVVGPSKHHKHSYYLIRNSELMGVSDDELDVIANIARFHRKSAPGPGHDEFAELVRSDKHRVKKLAAILRVADSLDREHKQQVEDMVCEAGAGRLRLTLRSSSDCLLERWALEERSGMFNDVFKLGIETRLEPAPARSGPANGLYSRSYSAVVGKGPAAGNGPSGR